MRHLILIQFILLLFLGCNIEEKKNKITLGHVFTDYRSVEVAISDSTALVADGVQATTITVTLKDKWSRLTSGDVVNLTIPSDGGTANATSITTNSSGQVHFTITSSTVTGTYNYTIESKGNIETFQLIFISGPPVTSTLQIIGPSTIVANGASTTTLRATVIDTNGNRVPNIEMQLLIPQNGGTIVGDQTPITNSLGEVYYILRSSTSFGIYSYLSLIPGINISPSVDIGFIAGTIDSINLNIFPPAILDADGTSTKTLVANIIDSFSNPLVGAIVTLNIPANGGTVPGTSVTGATGDATFSLTSSTVSGNYNYTASAGGRNSPIVSLNMAALDPSSITLTITGTNNLIADGTSTTTLMAHAQDINGNPSDNRTLILNIPANGGSAIVPVMTDSLGNAYYTLTSSTVANLYSYTVSFNATVSNVVNITFFSASAANITLSTTGSTSITADGISTTELVSFVTDAVGNPVENTNVTFNIPLDGGSVPGDILTDASGTATFTLTSSTLAATYFYTTTTNSVTSNSQSIIFTSDVATHVFLLVLGDIIIAADGLKTTDIEAIVTDANFNPVSGETVTLNIPVNGGTVAGTIDTDIGGAAIFTLTSSIVLGVYSYTATIAGPLTSNTETVEFANGILSTLSLAVTGNATITANNTDTTTIDITALDAASAPLPGETITLNIPANGGSAPGPITTNGAGIASFTLTSSTTPGSYTYYGNVGSVNSNNGLVNFIAGPITTLNFTTTGASTIVANGVTTTSFTINAIDTLTNPVIGATVHLNIPVSGGTVPGDVFTDSSGDANFTLTSSIVAGSYTYTASAEAFSSGNQIINFIAGPISNVALSVTGSSSIIANGSDTTTFSATATDANANPKSSEIVTLNIPVNGGTVPGTVTTNASGNVNFTLTSSVVWGKYDYNASAGAIISADDSVNFVTSPLPTVWSNHSTSASGSSEVQINNQNIFLADSENGLMILNVTSTATASYDPGADLVSDVALDSSFNYAYLAGNATGVLVIDVSDTSNPTHITTLATTGSAVALTATGNYLYVADGDAGLQIYDITTASAPIAVGSIDTNDIAIDVEINGNYAYVTATNELTIIDISTKAAPTLTSTYSTDIVSIDDLKISGNYAYLSNSDSLLILDISTPSAPTTTATIASANTTSGIEIYGDYAYLSVDAAGVEIFNISNPAIPLSDNSYIPAGIISNASGIGMNGSYIFLLEDEGGVQIIDISDPTTPDQAL